MADKNPLRIQFDESREILEKIRKYRTTLVERTVEVLRYKLPEGNPQAGVPIQIAEAKSDAYALVVNELDALFEQEGGEK